MIRIRSLAKKIDQSLLSTTAMGAALKIVNMALSFAVVVLLARTLGAEGYGVYTLAFVFCSVLSIVVQFGLPNLTLRETAQASGKEDWERLHLVWRWVSKRAMQFSVLVVSLASIAIYLYFSGFESHGAITALISLLLLPVLAFDNIKSAALRGLGHVTIGQLSTMLFRPSIFLLLTVIVVLTFMQVSPAWMMFLRVVSALVTLLFLLYMFRQYIPEQLKNIDYDPSVVGDKGWPLAAASMAVTAGMTQITNYADLLLLGYFQPVEEVGQYRVAVQLAALVIFGMRTVSMVSAPRFARAKDNVFELQRLTTLTSRISLSVAVLIGGILAYSGETILTIVFGVEYREAALPLVVLVFGQIINALFGPIGIVMAMVGLERIAARTMLYVAILNVCLNTVLIPYYGAIGAALATVLSFMVWNFVMWWKLKSTMQVRCDPFSSAKKVQ